jgi:hypothetical protein
MPTACVCVGRAHTGCLQGAAASVLQSMGSVEQAVLLASLQDPVLGIIGWTALAF